MTNDDWWTAYKRAALSAHNDLKHEEARLRIGVLQYAMWFLTGALLGTLMGMAISGCGHAPLVPPGALPGAGLRRLYLVEPGLYRSEQPSAEQFAELARRGVRSVIKLNSAWEGRDDLPPGVELLNHDWYPAGPVDHEDVVSALTTLEHAERPVLVHCEQGRDRTGLLVALWRVRSGWLPQRAFDEWVAFGSHRFRMLEAAFWREVRP